MYTICGPGLEVLHVGLVLDVFYMWTRTRGTACGTST